MKSNISLPKDDTCILCNDICPENIYNCLRLKKAIEEKKCNLWMDMALKKLNCVICNEKFESKRRSKLTDSVDCERVRKSIYDSDRYLLIRNQRRAQRREMLKENYSISSSNAHKLNIICDECKTQFYWNYDIIESFDNTHISSYNVTPSGEPCCPNCGLVLENNFILENEVTKGKIKKQATYCSNNKLDFLREAEQIRHKRNIISNIGELNKEETKICLEKLLK